MKTFLLIIPLSLSISVFGQIKMTGSRGGGLKNAPTSSSSSSYRHKPPVSTNHSSSTTVSTPVTSRPTSNSSSHSVTSGSTNMNGPHTNMNNSFPTSSRQHNNGYRSPYRSSNPNENGTNQLLEGYDNIAVPTQGSFVKCGRTNLVRTIVDQIDRYTEESTDIVILIDISGSMGNNVKALIKESDLIISSVPSRSRIGAASFIMSNSSNWFRLSDLNEDHWKAMDFIGQKRKYRSSESHYDAIVKAVQMSSWENDKRMIITITDEYIAPAENKNSEKEAIQAANSKNVALHTILLEY